MKISNFLNREHNNLDLVRVILSCLVIVGHSPILNGSSSLWADPIGFFFKFTYSGSLAVKLFFFISGLVVTHSLITKKRASQFVISRVFRLMPALFFVLIITVFVFGPMVTSMSIGDYFSNLNHLQYIFNNLLFKTDYYLPAVFSSNIYPGAVNGSLWSLSYEVGCYIGLLGLFLILQNQKAVYWKYIFFLILTDTLLPYKFIFGWLGNNPDIYLLPVIFSFGAFSAIYAEKIEINLKVVLGTYLIFFLFKDTAYAQLIFVFAACATVIYVASNKHVLKFKPKYDISYGIYLWGFLIQQTLYHFFGHLYVGLHCLLAIVISVILSLITHILIEKPFMDLGRHTYNALKKRFTTG
jgi:peptidoglycan/LPS O-acetylase OafA/YrhL